jgi:hypothetical protein
MRLFRTLGAIVLSVGLTSALPGPATAAPAHDFGNGIIATYKGKSIDLSQGWQGAQACAQFAIDDVRCYDTAAEANLATQPTGKMSTLGRPDCPSTWVCIWEHADFAGRRLQWSEPGAKKLANWNFENQTSSVFLNRIQRGMEAINYRNEWWDQRINYCAGCAYNNLADHGWNDKIDEVKI